MYGDALPLSSMVIVAKWSDIVAATIRGIPRVIFYGAPPGELMTLFSVWPTDVLVISLVGDEATMCWIPEPLRMWRNVEEANMATPALLADDLMLPPPPPLYPDVDDILPPTYEQVVSSSHILISDDKGDDDDDDDDDDDCQLTKTSSSPSSSLIKMWLDDTTCSYVGGSMSSKSG